MFDTIDDATFEELVEYATQRIHFALLENGGKGMKSAVHLWLGQTILWNRLQEEKAAKAKKIVK